MTGRAAARAHRHASIDIGRYLLLPGVIFLHVIEMMPPAGLGLWSVAMQNLSHVAVPVYFVAAGYFLSWRSRNYRQCIVHPTQRLLPLYLFWMAVYIACCFVTVGVVWPWTLHDLIGGGPAYHLWFLPALLAALIGVALASKAIGTWGALAICAILAGIGLSRGVLHDILAMPGTAQRSGILMAPLFVWLGTAVRSFMPQDIDRRAIWTVAMLLLFMQGAENAMLSYAAAGHVFTVRAFPVMMFPTSVAVFLAIRSIPASIWPAWMVEQSRWSFGVYAVHLFVIYLVSGMIAPTGPFSLLTLVAIVFVLSSLIARLIGQVPGLRRFAA